MAWYDEAVFYHIYPLGLTDAPKENSYGPVEHRLNTLLPWISHIKEIGCNALYIGPLFESVGHGYETTDYKKLDSRLGDNKDLANFVSECHAAGIKVIFDGVFNHTGRDFFAFKDIQKNRENSPYRDWYCNVNFGGNTEYNDGFSYENWGGYNLLVKLNQRNPAVKDYICDAIRFWVREFDVDGIRLDAADVLDFDFMQALRHLANEVKPDFWLMGEVIHGDYSRWVNEGTLHSVTNYQLHKALYSGHNDHNFFEIAHTVKRLYEMGGSRPDGLKLYNFVDNHDVERIYTKLNNKAHFAPVHILMYTLPGIPSVYYGSEFAIEGRKEKWSDASLRPALNLSDFKDAVKTNPSTELIAALGHARQKSKALAYGDYRELLLTNRQYAFSRNFEEDSAIVTVNNDDNDFTMTVGAGNSSTYVGVLSGEKVSVNNGCITVNVKANYGELWLPENVVSNSPDIAPIKLAAETPKASPAKEEPAKTEAIKAETETSQGNDAPGDPKPQTPAAPASIKPDDAAGNMTDKEKEAFEKGKIAGLQEAILATMEKNGPLTDQMRRDVANNVYHDSLINWIKSFR
ncbi:MAG: alpha-amylase [Lachnospiraceae bacterium]|uniref:alpha-amylase family glycosyl hydrolase n=1 Tax=Roseburia sp. 1XD42-69 TaxID=2320088 RepID=UPI000EA219DC|nr:alpha-amylase family glycosyl hydrolase [Roseburia sp. 1XD42-69]MCI8877132.1 alpha-amylase [Lachnospiraceae bacterium]MCI9307200.1 alpha-amylase [Lachnospiraceae bacterium]RKJ66842.1 alpha-amylase [Roseburia sp. 1XD42-69]